MNHGMEMLHKSRSANVSNRKPKSPRPKTRAYEKSLKPTSVGSNDVTLFRPPYIELNEIRLDGENGSAKHALAERPRTFEIAPSDRS